MQKWSTTEQKGKFMDETNANVSKPLGMLEKLEEKLGGMLDKLEEKPIESLIKVLIIYVVFKQLFKNRGQ